MSGRRSLPVVLMLLFVLVIGWSGVSSPANAKPLSGVPVPAGVGQPDPDSKPTKPEPGQQPSPNHLTHPCSGMLPEPTFAGLSPLTIEYTALNCTESYGDIGVWQANGHDYVILSGFSTRMFHIFNVDDPYNPVLLRTMPIPPGGSAGTSASWFKQRDINGIQHYYVTATVRGSVASQACGFYVYNADDPANPVLVDRKFGADWCTVHEHFISYDTDGDADYAWLAMGNESGSLWKVVVMDLQNLPTMTERGRYQRTDANSGNYVHDVNVVGNRVFLAHWGGGLIIHDKQTLVNNVNPTPLNPIDSIRPSGFNVHHVVPTTDGNHVLIEDEFINSTALEKIKMYNISDINNPFYETGIIGTGEAMNSQAHNMRIKNIGPGQDLMFVGWYKAGTRGFTIDTTGPSPTITQTFYHQLRSTPGPGFGNVWGVDYLPCTLDGQPRTCIYSGDMTYGLVVDALDYTPALDPYAPEVAITDPVNSQVINACTYTIRGNAHDYYSGVAQIEVSTDNGATWHPAQGTTSWTYEWTVPAAGPYSIQARATDNADNPGLSTVINVTVTSPCTGATTTPQTTPTSTIIPEPTGSPFVTHTSTATRTPTQGPGPSMTATPILPTLTAVVTGTPAEPSVTAVNTATAEPTAMSTATATPCTVQFTDVPESNTFYAPVRCLACQGIMSGYSDGTFRPNNDVTRGQLSKIVANSAGFNEPVSGQTFDDVSPTDTFYQFIERMASRGIIGGYPCGGVSEPCGSGKPYFRPNANATRGQISKIVSEAKGYDDVPEGQTFEDVPASNTFYVWIERLASRGIMSGYPCGGAGEPCKSDNKPYFRPNNNATRGQTSKIVANTFFPDCQVGMRR
jgi:hypothetical protein